jgi:integrase
MITIDTTTTKVQPPRDDFVIDDAQLAAVAFLARSRGRTLDAYRHDPRGFFQWAADMQLTVLAATRPHIELFRSWMEERGLAASTIDRRLSTVCGSTASRTSTGRIASNPAQYVRRPQVHPSNARGLDRSELGVFLFTAEQHDCDHAAPAVLVGLNGLRVSEACATTIEDLGLEPGHRTLRIVGKGNKPPATIPLVPRDCSHDRPSRGRNVVRGPSCVAATGSGSIDVPRTGGFARSASVPGWAPCIRTCFELRSSWPPSTRAYRSVTCSSQLAMLTLARPRSTTIDARTSIATPPTSSSPSWRRLIHPIRPAAARSARSC